MHLFIQELCLHFLTFLCPNLQTRDTLSRKKNLALSVSPLFLCRLLSESEESCAVEVNNPGCYSAVCVELDVASIAVNTLIQVCKVKSNAGLVTNCLVLERVAYGFIHG